jgi:hypothetical protein
MRYKLTNIPGVRASALPEQETKLMSHTISKPKAADLVSSLPEFVDHRGLKSQFGINRSHGYLLADEGKIRSVCIRRPGAIRGKRLWDCASVRKFLAKCEA